LRSSSQNTKENTNKEVELISSVPKPVWLATVCSRVCYSSLPAEELLNSEEDEKLVKKVVSMGHLSVVEHLTFTFKVGKGYKEEIFKALLEKPFFKVTEKKDCFLITANARTILELSSPPYEFEMFKKFCSFLPKVLTQ
jgi:thymidylate synthase ThyX